MAGVITEESQFISIYFAKLRSKLLFACIVKKPKSIFFHLRGGRNHVSTRYFHYFFSIDDNGPERWKKETEVG